MNIIELKYVPNNGTASDVAGIVSATIFKNTVNESKIVTPEKRKTINYRTEHQNGYDECLPSDNFSPESGGNANPNNAIDAINTHGTIKLKK